MFWLWFNAVTIRSDLKKLMIFSFKQTNFIQLLIIIVTMRFSRCITGIINVIKRYIATFLLKSILGWDIDKSYDEYESLRKGKHIITYAHTSDYEMIIGCLLAHAYNFPIITIAKDELGRIPVISKLFSILSEMIFIDKKSSMNATELIANDLRAKTSFVLLIAPEGTRNRVEEIKSGFYHIALETNSDIYHIAIDFENHTLTTTLIANDAVVQTVPYAKIKTSVEEQMKKDKPFLPERCHLVDPTKIGNTSLINRNKTLLIYIPPLIVLMIMLSTFVY